MSKKAMKLALEALEQIKRLTGARWALENNYAGHLEAITALREALAEQPAPMIRSDIRDGLVDDEPAQQEPVVLKWQQAPIRTAWGDDMVVASVAIDNDHTLSLYCERDQALKVDAMFAQRKPLTDEQIDAAVKAWFENDIVAGRQPFAKRMRAAIETAHSIKGYA